MRWVIIQLPSQIISYPAPATHQVQPTRIALWGPATRPTNVGTRNPTRAGLNCLLRSVTLPTYVCWREPTFQCICFLFY